MKGRAEQGLTLIEVLVALSIFAIVSVAVLSMFPAIFKLNNQTRADQAVTVGARQFMEEARVNFATPAGFEAGTLPDAPAAGTVNGYTCTRKVDPVGGTTPPIIKRVTLTCEHTTQSPKKLEFSLDFGRPSS